MFRALKRIALFLTIIAIILGASTAIYLWPRKLPPTRLPEALQVTMEGGKLAISLPTPVAMAQVGDYPRTLPAYLYLGFLRSQSGVNPLNVLLCTGPGKPGRDHRLFLKVPNNILRSVPYLDSLMAQGSISGFTLYGWSRANLSACREQSKRLASQFRSPPRRRLYQIPDRRLIGPMADFLVFKSETDIRVRKRRDPTLAALNVSQARQLAEDILVVSRFYSLPLDYFLAIGAMENNYMSVRGDLDHVVWKTHPQPGDVVLERRHGLVLVRNYSLGVWQITLDTLRYAELLYLRDRHTRDYSLLPKGLQPQITQNPDDIRPETLTTYAGLIFRKLLDRFHGNVMLAVGGYNGGPNNPNLAYADSVRRIARYAQRVIYHAVVIASNREKRTHAGSRSPKARHRQRFRWVDIGRTRTLNSHKRQNAVSLARQHSQGHGVCGPTRGPYGGPSHTGLPVSARTPDRLAG